MLKYIKNLISALFTKLFDGQEGQEAYAGPRLMNVYQFFQKKDQIQTTY